MEDDAAIQQERDIKFGFHTGRYEPSFFVPFVSPFSRGPSGFLPLTYVLAANAGVAAAADAAAVARPTKRRLVASDMSTESAAAIIAANKAIRIMPTQRQRLVMTEWDQCNFAAEAAAALDANGRCLPGRSVCLGDARASWRADNWRLRSKRSFCPKHDAAR